MSPVCTIPSPSPKTGEGSSSVIAFNIGAQEKIILDGTALGFAQWVKRYTQCQH